MGGELSALKGGRRPERDGPAGRANPEPVPQHCEDDSGTTTWLSYLAAGEAHMVQQTEGRAASPATATSPADFAPLLAGTLSPAFQQPGDGAHGTKPIAMSSTAASVERTDASAVAPSRQPILLGVPPVAYQTGNPEEDCAPPSPQPHQVLARRVSSYFADSAAAAAAAAAANDVTMGSSSNGVSDGRQLCATLTAVGPNRSPPTTTTGQLPGLHSAALTHLGRQGYAYAATYQEEAMAKNTGHDGNVNDDSASDAGMPSACTASATPLTMSTQPSSASLYPGLSSSLPPSRSCSSALLLPAAAAPVAQPTSSSGLSLGGSCSNRDAPPVAASGGGASSPAPALPSAAAATSSAAPPAITGSSTGSTSAPRSAHAASNTAWSPVVPPPAAAAAAAAVAAPAASSHRLLTVRQPQPPQPPLPAPPPLPPLPQRHRGQTPAGTSSSTNASSSGRRSSAVVPLPHAVLGNTQLAVRVVQLEGVQEDDVEWLKEGWEEQQQRLEAEVQGADTAGRSAPQGQKGKQGGKKPQGRQQKGQGEGSHQQLKLQLQQGVWGDWRRVVGFDTEFVGDETALMQLCCGARVLLVQVPRQHAQQARGQQQEQGTAGSSGSVAAAAHGQRQQQGQGGFPFSCPAPLAELLQNAGPVKAAAEVWQDALMVFASTGTWATAV